MQDFVILTDSSADLSQAMVQELGVEVLPLTFMMEGASYRNYPDNREIDPHVFYDKLRAGVVATTAAVNVGEFVEAAEPFLKQGRDVLILAFSSGLSVTYNSARLAAEDLTEQYPDRKIYAVDTLCASLGQGLLLWHAAQHKARGESIEAVRDWVEANKLHLCHWFTVDDLHFLKRGGRVSAATAVLGTMLSIKPVMHVDDEGHLINVSKARGRKASLDALVKKVGETATDPASQTMFISHSDCEADARYVADQIQAKYGAKEIILNYIGPVIGAHTGPGCVALFFVGGTR